MLLERRRIGHGREQALYAVKAVLGQEGEAGWQQRTLAPTSTAVRRHEKEYAIYHGIGALALEYAKDIVRGPENLLLHLDSHAARVDFGFHLIMQHLPHLAILSHAWLDPAHRRPHNLLVERVAHLVPFVRDPPVAPQTVNERELRLVVLGLGQVHSRPLHDLGLALEGRFYVRCRRPLFQHCRNGGFTVAHVAERNEEDREPIGGVAGKDLDALESVLN